ncbi:MAG: hypothetical protein II119_04215 [Bacilli bacterium]|nr:hypothetical protein [Bacilli bacterium]
MVQYQSIELTSGNKEFDAKVKNLIGIFNKLRPLFNITEYENKLESIQHDLKDNPSFKNKMTTENIQLTYEAFIYGPYIKRVEELTEKVERDLLPFYEIHMLTSKINMQLSNIDVDSVGEILNNAKLLVDDINAINTHADSNKEMIIQNAYKTIYAVIMYEEIFERSDILSYINYLNIEANKENIGRLLAEDIRHLDKQFLIDEDLRTLRTDGLGYDYLNQDFIRTISRKTVGENNSEYQRKKQESIDSLYYKISSLKDERLKLLDALNKNKKNKQRIYGKGAILATKAISIFLIPFVTISVGSLIGKSTSSKITEYKTITRTVDFESGKVISEPKIVYDEKETTYVATIMEYSQWKKNPTGIGYIRNVTAFEFTPDTQTEKYNITSDDLNNNLTEKYTFVESKDSLNNDDSTTNTIILITETYQDKNDTQKSTKYIIPFTITGVILGLIIDIILICTHIYDKYEIQEKFNDLGKIIKRNNLSISEIQDRLLQMKEEVLELEKEYKETVKKYGDIGKTFEFPEMKVKIKKSGK